MTICSGDDDGPAGEEQSACGDIGPAQTLSQPCCTDYGIDACGAQLRCAALDGRSVSVCYAERSRLPGETCTEDALCTSGLCDPNTGGCAQLLGMSCAEGQRVRRPLRRARYAACDRSSAGGTYTCRGAEVGDEGASCMPCRTNEDCQQNNLCLEGVCKATTLHEITTRSAFCCASGEQPPSNPSGGPYLCP